MKNNSKNSWIIIAIIIIVAFCVYYFFLYQPSSQTNTLLEEQTTDNQVGAEVLSLLNQIQALHIDSSFFQSAAYQSLVDYTVPIPIQNVGRNNPFAPIPGYSSKNKI